MSPSASASVTAAGRFARGSRRHSRRGRALEEIQWREARGEAGAPGRRQHMVGAGHVVADGLRCVAAEEDGAGAGHGLGQPGGLGHSELQVLGREAIDQRRRLVEGADHDDRAVIAPARGGDVRARQPRQMRRHRLRHTVCERPVVGDEDRLRVAVVLGLGEQVRGDPFRLVGVVGDHQDSEGPAIMSMPTVPKTRRLAAAT